MANAAQAQNCVVGFRMIKDEIPIACDTGLAQSVRAPTTQATQEPLRIDSLKQGQPALAAQVDEPAVTSPSGLKCVGGYAWRPTAENSYVTMPMPCE